VANPELDAQCRKHRPADAAMSLHPIPTRWSHLLSYSGVGALVRGDDLLLVVQDTRRWTGRDGRPAGEPIFYVDLLRASLQIDKDLRQPPVGRELPNGEIDGSWIPALRFPGWMRCPACGLLHLRPWRGSDAGRDDPGPWHCHCDKRSRLEQVAWVVAHIEAGLKEVPWHYLTHRQSPQQQQCRADPQRAYLRLRRAAGNRRSWELSCDRCAARAPFQSSARLTEYYARRQPWERDNQHARLEARQPAQVIEVNDPRLYYPHTRNALVIPPESRIRRGTVIDRLFCNREHRRRLDQCRNPLARRGQLHSLADEYGCPVGELQQAWDEIEAGYPLYGQALTPGDLLVGEYQALVEEISGLFDDEDFVPRHRTRGWRGLATSLATASAAATVAPATRHDSATATTAKTSISVASPMTSAQTVLAAVDRLVAVTRLREIKVFDGFSRIEQAGIDPATGNQNRLPPDLDGSLDWLPAIELFGEGIFFTLDEAMLRRWEQQAGQDLQRRTAGLQSRFEQAGMRFGDDPPAPLTPRFILLHTLAHLLIRQLETAAGYPAASISERIYCAGAHPGTQPGAHPGNSNADTGAMAGILVYVAVPDVVGSLGGLAELADPMRFLRLLTTVFEHADWCSLDPVCAEHEGQGPNLLNLAACHACTLVPEPSCAYGNVLLDRCFVKGDLDGNIRPLLAFAAGQS
jgi:hypothetical protein